ncbi:hypothetical protein [Clostridium thermobutyricum]|uniref:Uncharacterized protein n=1 Tax=Clostridium thermobutyricum DSM 4928 TaxID=1121339 RepID=A0A1V4SRG5_9CLOT|nr:hypothetical protein [Clostridium thermobutyricum]OPX46470.1 hypothetical protein CLTHE_28700 [Clostridium thermobutyricum DSM 4928]
MKKDITLEDVKEFIRKYGYKYDLEIQEELDKVSKISQEEIEKELKKNEDLYKRLADM